jgi:acetolactate synthase-1/2/3 large subunit
LSSHKKSRCVIRLRKDFVDGFEREGTVESWPPRPPGIIYGIRKVLDSSDIMISDVGSCKFWAAKFYPVYRNNTFIIPNGFAAMGFALPAAIAAKLIYPKRNVVALCGDCGFMMNLQDLETACRLGLNIVVVIFNDNGYNLIKWKAEKKFGASFGVSVTNPDFVALAGSFGAIGIRLGSSGEFDSVLREALKKNVPVIIDVPIDYSNNDMIYDLL